MVETGEIMSNCYYRKMPSEEGNVEEIDVMGGASASPLRLEDAQSRARLQGEFGNLFIRVFSMYEYLN